MKKYLILSLLLCFFGINSIKAECSNADIVKYQELAKNINVTYDYVEENDRVSFTLKFSNISPGISIYDRSKGKQYDYVSDELVLDGYLAGKSYKFDYIAPSCGVEEIVYFTYQNMPSYNRYYTSELCQGIEEFKYCQKWTKEPSSYEEFERAINKYKESLNKKNNDTEEEIDGLFAMIYKGMVKYYYITIPIALVIIILIIILVRLYNKKNDLF